MNKKYAKVQSTRRSLIMSALSLVLCFAMLIGTTWAWFTDEVTSGVNQIKAGNLDVELYHKDKALASSEAEKVTETVKLFDDVTLWEPGAYAYETFTIKNVGNLAFKYSMQINAYNATVVNNHSLDEVLKVAVVETAPTSRQTYEGAVSLKGWSLGENEKPLYPANNKPAGGASEKTFTVVVYWEPTDHDNDWNMNNGNREAGKVLSVDLGINLVATQLQYESDSFGTDYDKTAAIDLPFIPMTEPLAETEELKIVVPEAESTVKEATVPAAVANAVFDKVFNGSSATDKSLTLVLNVEEKSRTETTFNYDIDMDAVIKEITGTEVTKNETKSINKLGLTFTDYVEVKMKVESGLVNVGMKHNGNDMTAVENKAAIPNEGVNENGYFHYDETTGDVTLWTKTFSPFTLSGIKPDAKVVHSDGNVEYINDWYNYENYAKGLVVEKITGQNYQVELKNGDIIVLLADIDVTGITQIPLFDYYKRNANRPEYETYNWTLTIDLNGHTYKATVNTGTNYTDSTQGVFDFGVTKENTYQCTFTLNIVDSSEAKNGKVINDGTGYMFFVDKPNAAIGTQYKQDIIINISGGTFEANNDIFREGKKCETNPIVNITGGTFKGTGLASVKEYSTTYSSAGSMQITNGKFSMKPGTDKIASGSTVTDTADSEGYYIVSTN